MGWTHDPGMDRFEKEYPGRIKARCGWTVDTHRGRRRMRWWVRITRDGVVLAFKDGLPGPDASKGWADMKVHDWVEDHSLA